nr:MAG TPA: hypothetical protein [Crassvirales sp.]
MHTRGRFEETTEAVRTRIEEVVLMRIELMIIEML